MKSLLKCFAAMAFGLMALSAYAQDKVVYHFDSGLARAIRVYQAVVSVNP